MDKKLSKWITWINEIRDETENMLLNEEIHRQYLEMVKNNKEIQSPSGFHEWTRRNYGSYVVMAIRRQLDNDKDVVSLRRLLLEMKQFPQILTKQWFRSLYKNVTETTGLPYKFFADGDFEKNAGSMEYFDPTVADADILRLEKLGKTIVRYANKQIAHRTKVKTSVTFSEINEFLDEFESIVKKYVLLLTASGYGSLIPVPQYDWLSIFTKTWIKPFTGDNDRMDLDSV